MIHYYYSKMKLYEKGSRINENENRIQIYNYKRFFGLFFSTIDPSYL